MRGSGVWVGLGIMAMALPAGALRLTHGGPYEVDEGSEIELSVLVDDPVGQVSLLWDLDGDEAYGDGYGDSAIFRAYGVPDLDGYTVWIVHVSGIDEEDSTVIDIPITVRNVPPTFVDPPGPQTLCVGQAWSADLHVTDPIDPVVVSVDDTTPPGATFRPDPPRLAWTPDAGAVGDHAWVVTAADDDGGVTSITIDFDVLADCDPGDGEADADADGDADAEGDQDAGADGSGDGDAGGDDRADAGSGDDADEDDGLLGDDDDDGADAPSGCGCRLPGTPRASILGIGTVLGLLLDRRRRGVLNR